MTPKVISGNLGTYYEQFVERIFALSYDQTPEYENLK